MNTVPNLYVGGGVGSGIRGHAHMLIKNRLTSYVLVNFESFLDVM